MKKTVRNLVILGVIIIIVLVFQPFYILQEGEQAVITRFGKIISVQTESGFKIKVPLVDNVVKYPNKILSWDGQAQRIPTKENQFIYVDPTSRWVIQDPAKFYETVNTVASAQYRLDDILDSTIRTIISENYLNEAVRSTNQINNMNVVETIQSVDDEQQAEYLRNLTSTTLKQETISTGRDALSSQMLTQAETFTQEFGIELEDIVIRQIRYSDDLTLSVYQRMIKERNQIAEAYRSYGRGRQATWEGKTENETKQILSSAYAQSEQLRGKADATATDIYADAYSSDPEFFKFWRTLESYKKTLPQQNKILSTDMVYFNLLYTSLPTSLR